MRVDDDVSRFLSAWVDEPESSSSFLAFSQLLRARVTDDHALAARVVTNVVGIIRKLYRCKDLKSLSIKYLGDTIKAAGHEQLLCCWVVEDALGLGQVADGVNTLPRFEINDFDCVVLDRSHKESLPSHVDTEMIDSAFDTWKRNVRFKRQDFLFLSNCTSAGNGQQAQHQCRDRCQQKQPYEHVSFACHVCVLPRGAKMITISPLPSGRQNK